MNQVKRHAGNLAKLVSTLPSPDPDHAHIIDKSITTTTEPLSRTHTTFTALNAKSSQHAVLLGEVLNKQNLKASTAELEDAHDSLSSQIATLQAASVVNETHQQTIMSRIADTETQVHQIANKQEETSRSLKRPRSQPAQPRPRQRNNDDDEIRRAIEATAANNNSSGGGGHTDRQNTPKGYDWALLANALSSSPLINCPFLTANAIATKIQTFLKNNSRSGRIGLTGLALTLQNDFHVNDENNRRFNFIKIIKSHLVPLGLWEQN
jgi:hypothetical protein